MTPRGTIRRFRNLRNRADLPGVDGIWIEDILLKTSLNHEHHPVKDKYCGEIDSFCFKCQKQMHADGHRDETKVYRFRQYDIGADAFKLSARMATQAPVSAGFTPS